MPFFKFLLAVSSKSLKGKLRRCCIVISVHRDV